MGAEDEADGQPGGVRRHRAAPGLGRRDQAQEGPSPKGRSVNFLLDTNVVSEWVKPQPNAGVIAWLAEVDEDRVFMSVVTLAEIRHGIERLPAGARRKRLDTWLRDELPLRFEGRVLSVDEAVADSRSEEHTSELQTLMRISSAVFGL